MGVSSTPTPAPVWVKPIFPHTVRKERSLSESSCEILFFLLIVIQGPQDDPVLEQL